MKDWIPLFQSAVWPLFLGLCLLIARKPVTIAVNAIADNFKKQQLSSLNIAGVVVMAFRGSRNVGAQKPNAEAANLPVPLSQPPHQPATTAEWWTKWSQYSDEYNVEPHFRLSHIYQRSTSPGQEFEVFIFVVRHQRGSDPPPKMEEIIQTPRADAEGQQIKKADFFLGPSWGNRTFTISDPGPVGIHVLAWGTFLVVCRITFTDNSERVIYRFIDFFMNPEYGRNAGIIANS